MRRICVSALACLLAASLAPAPVGATSAGGGSGERDYFNCFQAGGCREPALTSSTTCRPGRDYTVTATRSAADVIVLSFHGGRIEANTSGVSARLAARFGWSRYDFSAHGTNGCLADLNDHYRFHITAPHFDDPVVIAIAGQHRIAVSIHGYSPYRHNTQGTMCIGGRNPLAVHRFIASVEQRAGLFHDYALRAVDVTAGAPGGVDCAAMRGTSRLDPVNRTRGGAGGLQLELSPSINRDLVDSGPRSDALWSVFAPAVTAAMAR